MDWLFEFFFPNRLHRLAYFLRSIAANISGALLYANSSMMDPLWFWSAVVALTVYALFFIMLPRLQDVGMNGWWLVVAFIPVANIVLGLILLFRAPSMSRYIK